jgi:hypothetical protein
MHVVTKNRDRLLDREVARFLTAVLAQDKVSGCPRGVPHRVLDAEPNNPAKNEAAGRASAGPAGMSLERGIC